MVDIPRWVVSDNHWFHDNILEYCPGRKAWASTPEEMNEKMIAGWNERVAPGDIVLHCGDMAFASRETLTPLVKRLNGRIWLTRGNHDASRGAMLSAGIERVEWALDFTHPVGLIAARHIPDRFVGQVAERADWLIHGHLHGLGRHPPAIAAWQHKAIDATVDALGVYYPILIEELIERKKAGK